MEHCDIDTTLQDAGLSKTSQRVAVLSALIHTGIPLCVKDILDRIGLDCHVNKVTVYRILDSFKTSGIIREIPTDHGEKFYEMACRHNPLHPHFYCRVCRNLSCLPTSGITQEWLKRFRSGRESIESIVVNVSGVCAGCQPSKK
jgi:Fur family transcriptional regulator, ferric uptake regulator